MDNNNNNPHRPRDPRGFSRTPLKHNSSNDELDRNERGYAGYNPNHHRQNRANNSKSASPASGAAGGGSFSSYSSMGGAESTNASRGGGFGHYGNHRRESNAYRRNNNTPGSANNNTGWDGNTPAKEHHQREREKEREMMSIYGRGDEPKIKEEGPKKYHNPCRFAGHDHEWRDCPNNYRNKNKRPSFAGKYQGKEIGEISGGIGKSTSWGAVGGDYYGPASEGGSGGASNLSSKSSDWHDNARDNNSRGYKNDVEVAMIGSRSKSFGAESTTRERGGGIDRMDSRGFDIDNDSISGALLYNNNRSDRNYYSPASVPKPRASPSTIPTQHERGYSSSSFTPLSTGLSTSRRGQAPVQLNNTNIPVPPFHRTQSYDQGGVRDTKKDHGDDGEDSSFYRKLALSSSSPSRDETDTRSRSNETSSPPRGQDIHRLNSYSSIQDKPMITKAPSLLRSGSKVVDAVDTDAPLAPTSPIKQQPTKEEPVPPSLTCAELGAVEKVSKAEEIVTKMNDLMNKPTETIKSDTDVSSIRLPSKNEILKCMSAIDGKIKTKDDDALAVKKEIKEIEQEKVAEETRLLKQEEEKRQSLIDNVSNGKLQRRGSIQMKENNLATVVENLKTSMQDETAEALMQLQTECSASLTIGVSKLNSEISLTQNQVKDAEMTIEEIDGALAPDQNEGVDLFIDESDFVPTLDAPGKMASLISSVLQDNQRIASEAHHDSLAAIPYFPQSKEDIEAKRNSPTSVVTNEEWSNCARKVTGLHDALYTEPSQVPMYKENNEAFLEIAPQIHECIRVKKNKLKKRWEDLANQYLVRQMVYNEETGVNTETSERGGFFSITGRVDESGEIRPLENVRGNNPYRRPRRGVSPGDVVRSEYEQEQIIAEIAAKEAMEKRIKEGGCALPHQRGMLENSLFGSFSNGFLSKRVDDVMVEEDEQKNVNVWTDMEKSIFLDRFLHHPKDFRKISSFLRNKTTKDCISFYYNSKKTIPYKHALKEFLQRKKRHGAIVNWDATIQAALSVGVMIKPGESAEKPLKFMLPHNDYTFRTHLFHPIQMKVFNNLETVALNSKHHDDAKKPKRSNWFILDASSRKYIKQHHKDDKDSSKRKSITMADADTMEDLSSKTGSRKVQRSAEMTDVHTNEEKKYTKASKWRTDEKKLLYDALDKFGHDWAKVSKHVGTRTMSQVKNYFYDNKKQLLKIKEKSGISVKEGPEIETAQEVVTDMDNRLANTPDDTSTNPSIQEGYQLNPPEASPDVGLCMPVNQDETITSAEEHYRQQLLLEQQNQHYMQQQQIQLQQHHGMIQERLLHEQMQRMHDAQRMQEAQRMEDARQRHHEEILRHQQQQQWLAQFQQQQHSQHHQGNEWADQQQLHNIKSLLALRQEQQGGSYQSNPQNSEMERIFQERMRAVAAAALAQSQNDVQSQQQQRVTGLELYQRLQQQQHQQQQHNNNNNNIAMDNLMGV